MDRGDTRALGNYQVKIFINNIQRENAEELTDEWERRIFALFIYGDIYVINGDYINFICLSKESILVTVNNSEILILWDGSNVEKY